MDNQHTMVGAAWGGKHRKAAIEKVENGYKVGLAVLKKIDNPEGGYHHVDSLTYVFYTVEEVLLAIKSYLEAEQDNLRT